MYLQGKPIMLPQSMEVLPAVLSFLPRYARFLGHPPTAGAPARHKGVVDHREGVGKSPFDNNFSEMRSRMRVYLEREKVGSCSLLLRGRLQRRCQFQSLHLLQLLLHLRSEKSNFSPIVNDCKVHSLYCTLHRILFKKLSDSSPYSIDCKPTNVGFEWF